MIKLAAQLVPLKTDAEKEGKDLAKKYGVHGYPTILFLDSNGEVQGKISGYLPAEGFAGEMTKVISNHKDFPKLLETLKTKPSDGAANARMASILAGRGKLKEAEEHLSRAENAHYSGAEMAAAYNAVGDFYQTAEDPKVQNLDTAISYFSKADAAAQNSIDRSYAKISIVYCHLAKGDKVSAKKACEDLIAMKDASPDYVADAKRILESIK